MSGTIVYVYPAAAWSDYPGRQLMLTRALARYCRVVFLECNVGGGADRSWTPRAETTRDEGVIVVRDAMRLRYSRPGKRAGSLAATVDGWQLRRLLHGMGIDDFVYWSSAADLTLLKSMPTDKLVYDCIDPCFDPSNQAWLDGVETEFAGKAKLVFATAESLVERMRTMNSDVTLIPNGAPDAAFRASGAERPERLRGRSGPVVGYMGTIDTRFDAASVLAAAEALPGVTFCIVGRVNGEMKAALEPLRQRANVIVTGSVSSAEGEAYTAAFDVGLIPFVPGEMNDAINPCKMYMYLWAGVPVVATNIRECRRHAPYVLTEDAGTPLAGQIERALSASSPSREERRTFAADNSWDRRARAAIEVLMSRGLLPKKALPGLMDQTALVGSAGA